MAEIAIEGDTLYAILERRHLEVDQEAQGSIKGFEVRNDLCEVDCSEAIDRLELDHQDTVDEVINFTFTDRIPLIEHFDRFLGSKGMSRKRNSIARALP